MQAVTGTTINIEEVDNVGEVEIFGPTGDAVDQAFQKIKQITATPEVGENMKRQSSLLWMVCSFRL